MCARILSRSLEFFQQCLNYGLMSLKLNWVAFVEKQQQQQEQLTNSQRPRCSRWNEVPGSSSEVASPPSLSLSFFVENVKSYAFACLFNDGTQSISLSQSSMAQKSSPFTIFAPFLYAKNEIIKFLRKICGKTFRWKMVLKAHKIQCTTSVHAVPLKTHLCYVEKSKACYNITILVKKCPKSIRTLCTRVYCLITTVLHQKSP